MDQYTIKQAADILDVSKATIRRRIKSGKIAAELKEGPYGEQYFINADEIDQAVIENEVANIKEINKPITKDQFINELTEALDKRNKALVDEAVNKVAERIQGQEKANMEDLKDKYDKQHKINKKLIDEIKELKELQQRSFIDKIKDFFTK